MIFDMLSKLNRTRFACRFSFCCVHTRTSIGKKKSNGMINVSFGTIQDDNVVYPHALTFVHFVPSAPDSRRGRTPAIVTNQCVPIMYFASIDDVIGTSPCIQVGEAHTAHKSWDSKWRMIFRP